MKKSAITIFVLLSLSMLAGCGGGNGVNNSNSDDDLRTKPNTDFTVFKRKF